jgi:hypothetical protein
MQSPGGLSWITNVAANGLVNYDPPTRMFLPRSPLAHPDRISRQMTIPLSIAACFCRSVLTLGKTPHSTPAVTDHFASLDL